MDRLPLIGRACFAIGLVAFGILHVVYGDFVTRVVPGWPVGMPARSLAVYLTGAILIAGGVAILLGIKGRAAAIVLGSVVLLSFVFLHLPRAAAGAFMGGTWTSAGKGLVLSGGCLAVAATFSQEGYRRPSSILDSTLPNLVGRVCLGLFMLLGGVQHFRFVGFVATLVPSWIPGGGPFWVYFAGVALIAGGVGLMIPTTARLAAALSGVMIFLWVIMLHIPRAVTAADAARANETTAVFEALAFSGLAFLLAGTVTRTKRSGWQ
jgi:uncharacterized membrane protein